MRFEHSKTPTGIEYIRSFFTNDSLIVNELGQVIEIRLPDISGAEAVRMVRSLEKIGVILTVVSLRNGMLQLALKNPDAINIMLEKVILSDRKSVLIDEDEYKLQTIESPGWDAVTLAAKAEEQSEKLIAVRTGEEFYEPDALDLIDQGAVAFYQGVEPEDADSRLTKSPQYSTEGRMFKQKYRWEKGQLFNIDGTPVPVEEHLMMLESAKTSDDALQDVFEIHHGLVYWVAQQKEFSFTKKVDHLVDLDDLLQAGREALINAIRRHETLSDTDKKIPTSYFIECIKGGMLTALSRDRGGKVLRNGVNSSPDFRLMREEINRQNEDHDFVEPDLEELRQNTQFNTKKVRDLYQVLKQIPEEYDDENPEHQEDYYRPGNNLHEEDLEFGDQFDNYSEKNLKVVLDRMLLSLKPREERIIRLRFFYDKTLAEIGQEFNLSQDRIRQIEAKALRRLKHPSKTRILRLFLGEENKKQKQTTWEW